MLEVIVGGVLEVIVAGVLEVIVGGVLEVIVAGVLEVIVDGAYGGSIVGGGWPSTPQAENSVTGRPR